MILQKIQFFKTLAKFSPKTLAKLSLALQNYLYGQYVPLFTRLKKRNCIILQKNSIFQNSHQTLTKNSHQTLTRTTKLPI